MKLLIGILLSGCLLSGAEIKPHTRWRTVLYRSSIIALAAANAIDIQSSWGGRELTPMLRSGDGRFGARGAGIKLGMLAGMVSTEYFLVRKHPEAELPFSAANLAMTAVMSRIAANNYAVRAGKSH
jgi:hypothetical protein